jgi:Zn-dependent protease with chaperone function
MDTEQFKEIVARLERESAEAPRVYQVKVGLLALLGLLVLAMILGFASLGLLLVAGLVAALVLTGGKALIFIAKLGKLLVLLAIPVWYLLKSTLTALFTRFPEPEGEEITRAQAPQLFAAMDAMRKQMRGPRFHHVLITDEMNAAVVQRPLFGLFGFPRNYLILGLPLLESLAPAEALAVVAHEYGHLAGSHGHFGAFIYRLRLTWGTIQDLSMQWQGFGGRMLRRIVEWYAPYFNAYTFVLARANEYAADAAAGELVSPATAASALKRVNIAGAAHHDFFERTFKKVRDLSEPPDDIAMRWAQHAALTPPRALAVQWLNESLDRAKQVYDTHPVLRDRLLALNGHADDAAVLPAAVVGDSAATAWLGAHVAQLRRTIQTQWRERVRSPWQERHQELQARLARLAELRALPAPSADEQAERLHLQSDLEPETDTLPELVAFNDRVPDRALTLYLEGSLRLDRHDESGIEKLEHAMSLDPDAIKPACEKAYAFYKQRKEDDRAQPYADRWNARHEWEHLRRHQIETFDPNHELRSPDLDEETLARVHELLRAQSKGIARAWLARRVLPADPSVPTYVIAVEPTGWMRFRNKGEAIIQALASREWPMLVFICTLDGGNAVLKKKVAALPGTAIALR